MVWWAGAGRPGRHVETTKRVLALAVTAALSCTGCVKAGGFRTGEDAARHQARQLALEDAEQVAEEVERRQFPQGGGDPGTAGYRRPWTNAGMVERIASEFDGPQAGPSDRVLQLEIMPGQRWVGFLGEVSGRRVMMGRSAARAGTTEEAACPGSPTDRTPR